MFVATAASAVLENGKIKLRGLYYKEETGEVRIGSIEGDAEKAAELEENWRNSYRESLHCLRWGKSTLSARVLAMQGFYPARQRTSGAGGCRLYDALAGDAVLAGFRSTRGKLTLVNGVDAIRRSRKKS